MTEEIIIDGVNVAGCEFAVKPKNDNRIKCHCAKGLLQIAKMQEQPESIKSGLCENNPDCYYKQLKRLEQERDGLKSLVDFEIQKREVVEQERDELKKTVENQKLEYEELQCDLSEVENACGCYQSENAELKQENKDLKDTADTMLMANDIKKQDIDSLREANDRLEQENKALQAYKDINEDFKQAWYELNEKYKQLRSALEEIREIVNQSCNNCKYNKDDITCSIGDCGEGKLRIIENKINEVLNS